MTIGADSRLIWILTVAATALAASYLLGSIPFSYVIVKLVTGEDITEHGSGNIGSMNVRRTTGSWGWFALAVIADGLKGLGPVLAAKASVLGTSLSALYLPASSYASAPGGHFASVWLLLPAQAAVFGSVLGHNYSVWIALMRRSFRRTGKGLATGGGALLAYDWRYFVAALSIALITIALTRYMLAGQVAAAATLPLAAVALRSPDWPFAALMAAIVYAAHHVRFVGMLRGREPRLYVNDRMGPRG
jgi:glycerol-3-phosphate acyltransferase PlsY